MKLHDLLSMMFEDTTVTVVDMSIVGTKDLCENMTASEALDNIDSDLYEVDAHDGISTTPDGDVIVFVHKAKA